MPALPSSSPADKLSDLAVTLVDPNASKGTVSAVVNLALPIKHEIARAEINYTVTADLGGFAADRLMMNQKVEANALKVVANNQGYQVKGDVKINGQAASLDYRKQNDGDADIKLSATLDEASRARFGFDLGPAVSGSIPVKLSGKIGGDTRLGIDADLTSLKTRQCPSRLGQDVRQVDARHLQRGAEAAIDQARGHRDRRRRCVDQGID